MKFTVKQHTIVRPLANVVSIVPSRPPSLILSMILIKAENGRLTITATDAEMDMLADCEATISEEGVACLPAYKFLNIVRAFDEDSEIQVEAKDDKALVLAGKSRFNLIVLPANEFPISEGVEYQKSISLAQYTLKTLLDELSFAMANRDVRYYLNGLLLEQTGSELKAVATDGHRLAVGVVGVQAEAVSEEKLVNKVIIPRKAVLELSKLLGHENEIKIDFADKKIRATVNDVTLTSKLIDGTYPDYERVIPVGGDKVVIANIHTLKEALSRVAILADNDQRTVTLNLKNNSLKMTGGSTEQNIAQEEIDVDYEGDHLEIGFNGGYLLDLFTAMPGEKTQLTFTDNTSSMLATPFNHDAVRQYVIMPLRL